MNNETQVDRLVFDLDETDSDQDQGHEPYDDDDERKNINLSNLSLHRRNSRSQLSDDVRTFKGKFCECMKHLYVRLGMKHVIPFLILILYSVAGGAVFYYIESSSDIERSAKRSEILKYARRQVQERVWELHVENFTRKRILQYAAEALMWYENYTSINAENDIQWDFWGAVFYCGTIYTTIGYGNIAPITITGRILTMLYSAFGIPLILFILNDMGEVIGKGAYRIWSFMRKKTNSNEESSKEQQSTSKVKRNASFNDAASMMGVDATSTVHKLPMSVALGITLSWMLACSAIFSIWENWDYFTAFYFFFISLTTIGLGDIVPHHHEFLIMNFGLVLLGLSLVSMCIQVVQAKVEYIAQQVLHRISKRYQAAQSDGDSLAMPADELENTLNQIKQPTWLKALVSRKKKEKIMFEYKKRSKMRAKGSQTENYCLSIAVQTDDTVDWRKQYERELCNVQQLVQQLEEMYDNKERRHSIRGDGSFDENVPSDGDKAKKRRFSFKTTFKKSTEDIVSASPKKLTKGKSFRSYVTQVFSKSPKKKQSTPITLTHVNPATSVNKSVTITFNDGQSLEPTSANEDNMQISQLDDNSSNEGASSMSEIDNHVSLESKIYSEPKSRHMTLHLSPTKFKTVENENFPHTHESAMNTTKNLQNISSVGLLPDITIKPVKRKLSFQETVQHLKKQQPQKITHSQSTTSGQNNKQMYNMDDVRKLLENFHLDNRHQNNISNNNFSSTNDGEKSAVKNDDDIESFYLNKNQRFDFVDDDATGNIGYNISVRRDSSSVTLQRRCDNDSIGSCRSTKFETTSSSPAKLHNTMKVPCQSERRRYSLTTEKDDEDTTSFHRVPYALDDCKLLFEKIKHKIHDCQSIIHERPSSSTINTPINSFKQLCDRPLTLRHFRHGFSGGDLLRREISAQTFDGRR